MSQATFLQRKNKMAYPLRCFMPHDREVYVDGDHSIQCYLGTCDVAQEESKKFKVYGTESNIPNLLSLAEVEIKFHFNYTKHLIIAHERLLRQIVQDKYDCSPSNVSDGDSLSMVELVRMLNDDEDLEAGECLGEYTGVVSSHTSFDAVNMQAYCCQYSSCAGDTYINAMEYGNIIRFINHSNSPNAELRSMDIDLVPHVICFTKERIRKDEQIFISYGASYWQNKRQALEQLS
eukprot:gene40532-49407_t